MTDVNKMMSRTLSGSMSNLNATNMFAEPQAPAPRSAANSNQPMEPKVTSEQIAAHNALKIDIKLMLDAAQLEEKPFASILNDINQKYVASFDRLNKFFNEIQQVNLAKTAESENDTALKDLDQDLLNSMDKLSKVSIFFRFFLRFFSIFIPTYKLKIRQLLFTLQALGEVLFMAKNKHLYNADAIKSIDSTLSDDLTDILDQFFRTSSVYH